ncbi:MAG TPA: hypothetical protein VIL46_13475, partial [Gemmataceae bacterium]
YYTKPQQPVRPAAVQQPELPAGPAAPYEIRLEPPGPEELFRLESEAALRERLRQEARQRGRGDDVDEFPEEPVLSAVAYQGRSFPPYTRIIEPNYVCYRRLYFHQVNHERYGWDLGFITPVVSAGKFFWDVVRLPHDFASRPHCRYECSAGYCYPGDPVPYLLYPPGFTPLGLAAELGFATGLALIFP